uniref:Uncharacterized protein n=1 Tax=Timema monikensis TaxID=170555 RepID=A0A7R9E412_9NEOP|nr:unnamed protein product [Timema monikensis]
MPGETTDEESVQNLTGVPEMDKAPVVNGTNVETLPRGTGKQLQGAYDVSEHQAHKECTDQDQLNTNIPRWHVQTGPHLTF